jgi:hypothetical protein
MIIIMLNNSVRWLSVSFNRPAQKRLSWEGGGIDILGFFLRLSVALPAFWVRLKDASAAKSLYA